jgi:hypothetical protein
VTVPPKIAVSSEALNADATCHDHEDNVHQDLDSSNDDFVSTAFAGIKKNLSSTKKKIVPKMKSDPKPGMNSIHSYIYTFDILVSAKRSSKTVLSTVSCSSSDHIPARVPIAPSDIWAEFGPTGSQPDILPGMSNYYNSIKILI